MVCEQLSSTNCHIRINWDNAFAFNFPNGVVKQLIMNLKPIQIISTGRNTLESCLKQFFIGNWELRNFSMIGYVRWQNSWDNAFLRLFYTSLCSIPKRLASFPKQWMCSLIIFVRLLLVFFNPIKTEHWQSCFKSATNILVWSSEHQPTATQLL